MVFEVPVVFSDRRGEVGKRTGIACGCELGEVGFGEVLVFAFEGVGEVDVFDPPAAEGLDGGGGHGVEGVGLACAAVEDAALGGVVPEEEVDVDDVLDVDEVAALLAVAVAVGAFEQPDDAALFQLVVEVVGDRGHAALMVFLRPEDVEVAQADDLRRCRRQDAADVAVELQLGEGVDVERPFARRLFAEAAGAAAVHRRGGGVDEGDALPLAEMEQFFAVGVVGVHHVFAVVLHGVGAGAVVEDGLDGRAVEFPGNKRRHKVVFVEIVLDVERQQVFEFVALAEVVDNEDVAPASLVEAFDEVAADEAGAACYDDHVAAPFGYRPASRLTAAISSSRFTA